MKTSRLVVPVVLVCLVVVAAAVVPGMGRAQQTPKTIAVRAGSGSASLLHLSLGEMVGRADKVLRGTVIDMQQGTVSAGGGAIPVIVCQIRVDEAYKGSFVSKGGVEYLEMRMVGQLKREPQRGNPARHQVLPDPIDLQVGSEYLLLTTPPSAIGLSTAVGLGQGSFRIFERDKVEWAANEFGNAGLFEGPVAYAELAELIRQHVAR
jgi:hypothetical protein